MTRVLTVVVLFWVLTSLAEDLSAQCAMCKSTIENGKDPVTGGATGEWSGFDQGIYWSIAIMLGSFFSVVAFVVQLMRRESAATTQLWGEVATDGIAPPPPSAYERLFYWIIPFGRRNG